MPGTGSPALVASRLLLQLCRLLNLLTGVGLVVALVASFPFADVFADFFTKRPVPDGARWLLVVLRTWMVVALPMVGLVHVFLTRLLEVVGTVRDGDPFVPANAVRLRTIAWCGFALECLRLVFGVFAGAMDAAGSDIPWSFSLSGWLAVGLLFVLAQVFAEGTRLRDDLHGMV